MSESCVYFIQADESGPIKIGFTADDPRRRLSQLQTGNASSLRLLGWIKGTSARERQFHAALSQWRLQGEWFEPHPTVLEAIQNVLAAPDTGEVIEQKACLRCSFCFRCHHEMDEALFAGTAANICETCVQDAVNLIAIRKAGANHAA